VETTTATYDATATTDSNMLEGSKGDNRSVLPSEQSSFKRLKIFDAALLSTASKETTPTLEDIPSELFIQHIVPFVGCHQYRFVAAVNRNLHTAYVTVFPKKVTRFNLSTTEDAKICFDEKKGNYSIQCSWDARTCASSNGVATMDVNGIVILVGMQPKMGIWMSSNGVVKMDVDGMHTLVRMLPKMDIWMSPNGGATMDVTGIVILVQMKPKMDIWM
jgi:hypothetical protein